MPSRHRPQTSAEAARYGVLRRLAPALKHDMVVNLQAVAMMAEVLNARLDRGTPTPADFQKNISDINRLARDAVKTCLKVVTWMSPTDDMGVQLRDGVDECVNLMQSSFNFRGFTIASEVNQEDFEVSLVALRNLLAASLLTVADAAEVPGTVLVTADLTPESAQLTVRCIAGDKPRDEMTPEVPYRQMEWADVQALAQAESVDLVRGADQIVMRLPRQRANSALQIAPL
jgi:C4-dicarboxylate-specific signal transduction histidine kinase